MTEHGTNGVRSAPFRLKTKPAGISWVLSFFLIGCIKNGIIRQQVKEQLQ